MNRNAEPPPELALRRKALPWVRLKSWWNLPRVIGLAAILLGLFHYLPLPVLPIPSLIRLHADVASELVGIGITLVLIDWAVEKRQREELKAQLIRQMGSRHNEVADTAVRELAHHGWLDDGSLEGAWLENANLSGSGLEKAVLNLTNLSHAQLTNAWMVRAKLNQAILIDANLSGATLTYAELKESCLLRATLTRAALGGAHLDQADLTSAQLTNSQLQNADLTGANIRDADFSGANLRDTTLTGIRNWTIYQLGQGGYLSRTIMPDGKRLRTIARDTPETQNPSFANWKAHYLATHGGNETTPRDTDKSTNDAPTEH